MSSGYHGGNYLYRRRTVRYQTVTIICTNWQFLLFAVTVTLQVCHGSPVDFTHNGPVMRKTFPRHEAIMWYLTNWGRLTYICVSKLTIIASDNGLSPGRRQPIIWTNAGILLIQISGTNLRETSSEIRTLSFKKMRLKVSSGKWRPFCLGFNMLLRLTWLPRARYRCRIPTYGIPRWRHNRPTCRHRRYPTRHCTESLHVQHPLRPVCHRPSGLKITQIRFKFKYFSR